MRDKHWKFSVNLVDDAYNLSLCHRPLSKYASRILPRALRLCHNIKITEWRARVYLQLWSRDIITTRVSTRAPLFSWKIAVVLDIKKTRFAIQGKTRPSLPVSSWNWWLHTQLYANDYIFLGKKAEYDDIESTWCFCHFFYFTRTRTKQSDTMEKLRRCRC